MGGRGGGCMLTCNRGLGQRRRAQGTEVSARETNSRRQPTDYFGDKAGKGGQREMLK